MRRSCFPNSSSHQHGPPLLGRVRMPLRSPTSTLLIQPSDSLAPFGRRSGLPSPTAYLGAQALFFAATPVPTPTCATSETLLPRLPVRRLSLPKEKRGYPRCLGHPLRACRGPRPRRVQPPLARSRCGHRRLQVWKYPGHPEVRFISWLLYPRPTRSRAYASPSPLPFPAQGSLPARAGSPLAGRVSHPLDDKQGFMKSSQTPFLLDQPCLVALPPEPMLPEMPSPCAGAMTALWRCGEIAGVGETGAASD